MQPNLPYVIALAAFSILGLWSGWKRKAPRWQIWRSVVAIAFNWLAGTVYITETGDYTPWQFSLFIDSGAALAILYHPAGREQAFLGWSYGLQIAAHIVFGALVTAGYSPPQDAYYRYLTYIAFVQLLILGDWSIGGRLENYLRRLWPRFDATYRRARLRIAGEEK